jgi:pimeloyl-ACP methyl ester carboxylesterase
MAGEIQYARSGDASIAYQVVGDGPFTLVTAPGFVSHMEALKELPEMARVLDRLASFSRLIVFDKREQGLSDRVGRPPTIEEMVDDITAVMDATGTEKAALFGVSEGAAMALMFAATHPDRCTHLAIWNGYARLGRAPDYPDGSDPDAIDRFGELLQRDWGGPVAIGIFAPSRADDPAVREWWAHLLRSGTSPASAAALMSLYKELDVRQALPLITAPTLVMHRADDRAVPSRLGRYIAEHIEGARFVEFPGADHLICTEDPEAVVDEIEEFLTGAKPARPPERMLATVLFTDIVDSTATAAKLGDRSWGELLDRHDALVRARVENHQGRVVNWTGDGVLAMFDGPTRAIESARAIVAAAPSLGIEVRAGLHSGECELRGDDLGGMAVHIGARVSARAGPGEVLVSSTLKDLVVGSGIEFDDRGTAELKGVPGEWRLYALAG